MDRFFDNPDDVKETHMNRREEYRKAKEWEKLAILALYIVGLALALAFFVAAFTKEAKAEKWGRLPLATHEGFHAGKVAFVNTTFVCDEEEPLDLMIQAWLERKPEEAKRVFVEWSAKTSEKDGGNFCMAVLPTNVAQVTPLEKVATYKNVPYFGTGETRDLNIIRIEGNNRATYYMLSNLDVEAEDDGTGI